MVLADGRVKVRLDGREQVADVEALPPDVSGVIRAVIRDYPWLLHND